MSYKVWFITGASRGFGRVWADAALKRGDKVAATAPTLESIADLKEKYGANVLTLELDVTRPDQVKKAVAQAHAHFGRLDIVLNNAGYLTRLIRNSADGHIPAPTCFMYTVVLYR
jgi:NAD(P)-dependent dehydrogenase (short-subunit alcohol dehydrogenase family)